MRKTNPIKIVLIVASLALIAGLIYQLPPVKSRLSWRLEFAFTYLRGIAQPARPAPTPVLSTADPSNEKPLAVIPTSSQLPTLTPSLPNLTSTRGPTFTPSPTPTPIPVSVKLPNPAYEAQTMNNCGPATLTMYLRLFGWNGDQTTIAEVIKPVKEDRNVNVDELVYYVRNHAGWLSAEFRVGGTIERLKLILAAGMSVMVEEGVDLGQSYWPNDDQWGGHYLLLTGYDDAQKFFWVQDSFRPKIKAVAYTDVDTKWQQFNRVYIMIYLPTQESTLQNILGSDWDKDANRQHALDAAKAETTAMPQNPFTWFNLGSNLVYFDRYDEAAAAYDKARQIGLPQRMFLYQFGPFLAYFNTYRNADLLAITEYVLNLPSHPKSEEPLLWHGWALVRKGDREGAIADFKEALQIHPGYQDALYALNYLGSS